MMLAFGIGITEILLLLVPLGGVGYFIYRAGYGAGLAAGRREALDMHEPPRE